MTDIEKTLEQRGLRYKESDFWDNPVIGKEIVRFRWYNAKYSGHSAKAQITSCSTATPDMSILEAYYGSVAGLSNERETNSQWIKIAKVVGSKT